MLEVLNIRGHGGLNIRGKGLEVKVQDPGHLFKRVCKYPCVYLLFLLLRMEGFLAALY